VTHGKRPPIYGPLEGQELPYLLPPCEPKRYAQKAKRSYSWLLGWLILVLVGIVALGSYLGLWF